MQRNYTPQGKPQDPGALDRQQHEVQRAALLALEPLLLAYTQECMDLHNLVLSVKIGGHTTSEIASLVNRVRAKLGLKRL